METAPPRFEKAFVAMEIVAPKGGRNAKVCNTSNWAVKVVISNLNGETVGASVLTLPRFLSLRCLTSKAFCKHLFTLRPRQISLHLKRYFHSAMSQGGKTGGVIQAAEPGIVVTAEKVS